MWNIRQIEHENKLNCYLALKHQQKSAEYHLSVRNPKQAGRLQGSHKKHNRRNPRGKNMEILHNNISSISFESNIENVTQYTTCVFVDAWRVISVINSVCKSVMILIPASRWSSARLRSVALRDKDNAAVSDGLQRSVHTLYTLTKL